MLNFIYIGFGILTGIVTLISGWMTGSDYTSGRRINSQSTLPMRIRRSIRYKVYESALMRACETLEKEDFRPDFVIAIQYTALGPAAEIAKKFKVQVHHVEIKLKTINGRPVCQSVSANFDMGVIANKNVLIVDNRIYSGKTLNDTVTLIHTETQHVKTCVVYRPSLDRSNFIQPDLLLFKSKKKIDSLLR